MWEASTSKRSVRSRRRDDWTDVGDAVMDDGLVFVAFELCILQMNQMYVVFLLAASVTNANQTYSNREAGLALALAAMQ